MADWQTCYDLGMRELERGKVKRAIVQFERALANLRGEDHPIAEAKTLMQLGFCHTPRNIQGAREAFDRAAAIADSKFDDDPEARAIFADSTMHLAMHYALENDHARAISMLNDLVARVEKSGDIDLAINPLQVLADIHIAEQKLGAAVEFYKQAWQIESKKGDTHRLVDLLNRIADVCELQEHYNEARRFKKLADDAWKRRLVAKGIGLDFVSEHDRLTKEITELRGEREIAKAINKVLTPVVKKAAVPAWQMSDFDDFEDFLVGNEI